MANQRASLAAHQLADFHIPLPEPDNRERSFAVVPLGDEPEPPQSLAGDGTSPRSDAGAPAASQRVYPALARAKRERLVMYSIRLPLSQVEALEKLKTEDGIVPAELVRDFIAKGLQDIGKMPN